MDHHSYLASAGSRVNSVNHFQTNQQQFARVSRYPGASITSLFANNPQTIFPGSSGPYNFQLRPNRNFGNTSAGFPSGFPGQPQQRRHMNPMRLGMYNNKRGNSHQGNQSSTQRQSNGHVNSNSKDPNEHRQQDSVGKPQTAETTTEDGSSKEYRFLKRGETVATASGPTVMLNMKSGQQSPGGSNHAGSNVNSDDSKSTNSRPGTSGESAFPPKDTIEVSGNVDENAVNGASTDGIAPNRTPVSLVGDLARFHGLKIEYRLVKEIGPPHAPTFTVTLHLGEEQKYEGTGSSIKKAQHAAAMHALSTTELSRPAPRANPNRRFNKPGGTMNLYRPNWALIQLTRICEEFQEPVSFVHQPVTIVDPFRRVDPPSVVTVKVGELEFNGEGPNYNAAKNMAVMQALTALLKMKQQKELCRLEEEGTSAADLEDKHLDAENKSPISLVHEMAMKRGLTVSFEVTSETGPPHMKNFTVQCTVNEMITEGEGATKQAAKKTCSERMIVKLKEIPIPVPTGGVGTSMKAMHRSLAKPKSKKKSSSTPVVKDDIEKQVVNPISRLIQIAHVKKFKEPVFNVIAQPPEEPAPRPTNERERRMLKKKKPIFTIEVLVGPHTSRGTGPNKKAAKKAAAEASIVLLGYGPVSHSQEKENSIPVVSAEATTSTASSPKDNTVTKEKKEGTKLTTTRQIVPGIIAIKKDTIGPVNERLNNIDLALEVKKVNKLPPPPGALAKRDGVEKLNYLAKLLDVTVSFSDFPKRNEYLSVVSFGTTPAHVAHGIAATLEEAQNSAAIKIIDELSESGLENGSDSSAAANTST